MTVATELVERLESDEDFASELEHDPFTTLRTAGLDELAIAAERERDQIAAVVERIYEDDEFRQAVERDPSGALAEWVPEIALAPVLVLAGAPDEVIERANAEVEAHVSVRKPLTIAAAAAALGTLAFAQEATAANAPAATTQARPAATAQVSRVAVSPQVRSAVARTQVVRSAQAQWQGVSAQRVLQHRSVIALLRGQQARF
jgi:hypothetical protein